MAIGVGQESLVQVKLIDCIPCARPVVSFDKPAEIKASPRNWFWHCRSVYGTLPIYRVVDSFASVEYGDEAPSRRAFPTTAMFGGECVEVKLEQDRA